MLLLYIKDRTGVQNDVLLDVPSTVNPIKFNDEHEYGW